MIASRIHWFVAVVAICAGTALLVLDWGSLGILNEPIQPSSTPAWLGLVALFALGILSEYLSVQIQVGNNSGASSIVFIPLLAALLLFGPIPAALLALGAGIVGEVFIRRKPPLRATFNISQYFLSALIAGHLFSSLGGTSFLHQAAAGTAVDLHLGPFVAFVVLFLLVNTCSVAAAISLSQSTGFIAVWSSLVGKSGSNLLYDLLISPIAVAVAYLYRDVGLLGLAVTLLPLLFIRHSYFVNHRLQGAIRDLLTALIKTIETRDPYTSGHSIRVSELAERIAKAMGLPRSRIANCRNAALLHDIGKIDPVYVGILKKPHSLTSEERAIIESHVEKGAELIKSMASFPSSVIAAIRHHHEHFDGSGYPDGLQGDGIPLEARIIKVCDAIDAMMSDRPYRNALSIAQVRSELLAFSERQFDPDVIGIILQTEGLLEGHRAKVAPSNQEATSPVPSSDIEFTSVDT